MRLEATNQKRGQAIVLVLIVVAVLAGGYWMMISSRRAREQDAHRFAREAATRLFLQQDSRFLNQTLAPGSQSLYLPSWRDRFFALVRELGPAQPDFEIEGEVRFISEFFQPTGVFRAKFIVPSGPAFVDLTFSHHGVRWEIDGFTLTLPPPPVPPPMIPLVAPPPSASPNPPLSTQRPKR